MNASGPLLALRHFAVSYGTVEALHEIELEVHDGEIVTVIGPNGAGKSTLLNAVMGLLPSRGAFALAGTPVAHRTVETMVAHGVALVPERRELFGEMSVADNLLLGGFARWMRGERDQKADLAEVLRIFPQLLERQEQMASTLSGGERQMLAIGRALMGRPRLLMLDEPSLGLAPIVVRDVLRTVGALRERGVSILLVEQNARAALRMADRAYVLETGSLVLQGAAADVARDPRVIASYLGGSTGFSGTGA